ncbi:TraR/DksA family transcriptional regulator [Tropicimonas sp. S265A]|uniref:TraR/DksA family transcriptional regulator n=1 Tax=Tropicimonas sp. S265A TaxID=3415134 RepID=UPI003C7A1490
MQFQDREDQLKTRRTELLARLKGIDTELESHQSRDWEELAVERESDEVLEHLGEAGLKEVRLIDMALDRMKDGSYGICTQCGERISAERLNILPFTGACRTCAGAG